MKYEIINSFPSLPFNYFFISFSFITFFWAESGQGIIKYSMSSPHPPSTKIPSTPYKDRIGALLDLKEIPKLWFIQL